MSNKQSSLDYYITKSTEILGPEIIKQISRDDNERIARLEKQAKAMREKEIKDAFDAGEKNVLDQYSNPMTKVITSQHYYNETYGNTNGN